MALRAPPSCALFGLQKPRPEAPPFACGLNVWRREGFRWCGVACASIIRNMKSEEQKKLSALKALEYVKSGMIIGVGTGSTVNYFIDALAGMKANLEGAVASSVETEKRLKKVGIPLVDLNSVAELPLYVDGADEVNRYGYMIKGGGGALTREKIVAAVAKKFVCVVDDSKMVGVLGKFPLPVEVIPMARSFVARELVKLGGNPVYRAGFVTDNHNIILDVHNFEMLDPVALEQKLNNIPGIVTNGIFALRPADVIIVSGQLVSQ